MIASLIAAVVLAGYPLPVGRGKGEGPLCEALFFSTEPKNFDAWRPNEYRQALTSLTPRFAPARPPLPRGEVIDVPIFAEINNLKM